MYCANPRRGSNERKFTPERKVNSFVEYSFGNKVKGWIILIFLSAYLRNYFPLSEKRSIERGNRKGIGEAEYKTATEKKISFDKKHTLRT